MILIVMLGISFLLLVLLILFALIAELVDVYAKQYPKFQNVVQRINNFLMKRPFKDE